MYFDGEFTRIGRIDPAPLQGAVLALPEARWYEETGRQATYVAHRHTQTIPLVFDPDMRHAAPTVHPAFADFATLLAPALDCVAERYGRQGSDGPGYFVRIILVRLSAGSQIATHRDYGASLSRAHRVHLPIVTNAQTEFAVEGVVKHLPAGDLWEINNRKLHAVRNLGPDGRIHAVIDYVVPGEQVNDPDGSLVA